jgi:hypothetical protein
MAMYRGVACLILLRSGVVAAVQWFCNAAVSTHVTPASFVLVEVPAILPKGARGIISPSSPYTGVCEDLTMV